MNKPEGGPRSPNVELRKVISSAGITYDALASSVRVAAAECGEVLRTNRSAIAHWVAGTRPTGATARYLAEALSRHCGRVVSLQAIGLAQEHAVSEQDLHTDTLVALNELGRIDLDMERRRALTTAAYSVAGVAMPEGTRWARTAERSAGRPATSHRRVGQRDLDAARDMASMFSRIDQRHGGGHARKALVQYLTSDISHYLNGHFSDDRVRRELFSTASELAYLSGWMAFDNAEHPVAQQYFSHAISLSAKADDAPMAGHVLRAMAHQAVDLWHPRQALNVAEASISGKRYTLATPRERALLGVVHARALAVNKRRKAAAAALLLAENDLSRAKPGDDDPPRVFFFTEASLAHETACTLRDTGDLQGAQREFWRSVRTRETSTFSRTHAVTLGYLGAVQSQQGAIEEACRTWAKALDAMDGIRSARARRTAQDMRRALSPMRGRGIPVVAELDQRAGEYLIETA